MQSVSIGRPLIDLIKLAYHANAPVLLSGTHGIGKSESFGQAATELGVGVMVMDLSVMEPSDLLGLPQAKDGLTINLPPALLPTEGAGLLVLEELNRADRSVRAPALQLLSARCLNQYKLPDKWLPMAAINPSEGEYQTDELDPALLSRFIMVNVVSDRMLWLDWARRNNIHPAVTDYVESEPAVFDSAFSNPRSWTRVSQLLYSAEMDRSTAATVLTVISGSVGEKHSRRLMEFLRQGAAPLSAKQVLYSYDAHRNKVLGWSTPGNRKLLESTMNNVLIAVQDDGAFFKARSNKRHWRHLGKFFGDLPSKLQKEARETFTGRGRDFPVPARRDSGNIKAA